MVHEGMRAGDGDRQKVADQLKAALDEGRLDLSEYDERIQKAYGARTYGDLQGLLDDLPGTVPVTRSQVMPAEQQPAPVPAKDAGGRGNQGRSGLQGMAFVFVICVLVWAMSGADYFWPGWVLIPVALAALAYFRDRGNRGH